MIIMAENYLLNWRRLGPITPNTIVLCVQFTLADGGSSRQNGAEVRIAANLTSLPAASNDNVERQSPTRNQTQGGFELVISKFNEPDWDSESDSEDEPQEQVLFRKTYRT